MTLASSTPSTAATRPSSRIQGLDVLRGVAAMAVVLFHYTTHYNELYHYPTPPPFTFNLGHYGVQMFFMISGYVILMTLDRAPHVAHFAIHRFARLYPVFWASVIVTFVAVRFFHLPDGSAGIPLRHAAMNLTMVHKFIGGYQDVDGVYWTLQAEMFFYILMGAIVLLGLRRFLIPIMAALVLLAFLQRSLGVFDGWPGARTLVWVLNFNFLHLFLLGILFYTIRAAGVRWYYVVLMGLCILAARASSDWTETLVVACIAGITVVFSRGRLPGMGSRVLLFLGSISYPLYLLHQNLGYIVIYRLMRAGLPVSAVIVLAVLAIVMLAAVLSFTIEKPANRYIRARYEDWTRGRERSKISA